jgi:pantothenate kinase
MSFIEKVFPEVEQNTEKWSHFVEKLQLKKDFIDLDVSRKLCEKNFN